MTVVERDSPGIVVLHLRVDVIYFFLFRLHQFFFFHFRQNCFHSVRLLNLKQNYKQLQFCQNWSVYLVKWKQLAADTFSILLRISNRCPLRSFCSSTGP